DDWGERVGRVGHDGRFDLESNCARARSRRNAPSTTAGRSSMTMCPAPGTTTSSALGNESAIAWLFLAGVSMSLSPQMITVGTGSSTLSASSLSWVRKVSKNSVITSTDVAAIMCAMQAPIEGGALGTNGQL